MSGLKRGRSTVCVSGPLARCMFEFQKRLAAAGYAMSSQARLLRVAADLSSWLQSESDGGREFGWASVDEFLAARGSRGGIALLLDSMLSCGVLPVEPLVAPARSPLAVLLDDYAEYLDRERGLATTTARADVRHAERFLRFCGVDDALDGLAALDAAAVHAAVLRESASHSVGSTQRFVSSVRGFLRYCHLIGRVVIDLSPSALWLTGRRRSQLPIGISDAQSEALLGSCDRRRAGGRRDYAVILLLLRLGLRAAEVAALSLEDMDWSAGLVTVHGKGRRVDQLPLPADVGAAIAAYLRRGRPRVASRAVFVRAIAPRERLNSSGVSSIVQRAGVRAGLPPLSAHRLRHTVACQMIRAGTPLAEIGAVLRHRDATTTAIYARVDVEQLRRVARPWPDGALR